MEYYIRDSFLAVTLRERFAEGFIQGKIRATSSLFECFFKYSSAFRCLSNMPLLTAQKDTPNNHVSFMANNWTLRKKSTEEMICGSKKKACALSYLREKDIVYDGFDVAMLCSKKHPVLGSSPDAIALLHFTNLEDDCGWVQYRVIDVGDDRYG